MSVKSILFIEGDEVSSFLTQTKIHANDLGCSCSFCYGIQESLDKIEILCKEASNDDNAAILMILGHSVHTLYFMELLNEISSINRSFLCIHVCTYLVREQEKRVLESYGIDGTFDELVCQEILNDILNKYKDKSLSCKDGRIVA